MRIRQTFTYNGKRFDISANDWIEFSYKVIDKVQSYTNSSVTVDEWFKEWLEIYKSSRSKRTRESYYWRYKKHIQPFIGRKKTCEVTKKDCQIILNHMHGQSKNSIHKIYNDLHQLFAENDIDFKKLQVPNGNTNKRRALTEEEISVVKTLLPFGVEYWFMLNTGARPHELPLIKSSDLVNGVLHIRGVKTDGADRYVPLPKTLINDFPAIVEKLQQLNTESKRAKNWKKYKTKLEEKLGCETDLVPYCFRHTYASRLSQLCVPVSTIRELLGHSSLAMTQEYIHTLNHNFDEIGAKIIF